MSKEEHRRYHVTQPCATMPEYGLYLVTGRELLPEGVSYLSSLEETLRDGHVTIVQIRYVAPH